LPGDRSADIGLVLVIGGDDLDLQALLGGLEVLDRGCCSPAPSAPPP
jgi:hypothetical protein